MSNQATIKKIEKALDRIRPYILSHKGDVKLEKITSKTATFRISGACSDCVLSQFTYNRLVKGLIHEAVPEITRVIFLGTKVPRVSKNHIVNSRGSTIIRKN